MSISLWELTANEWRYNYEKTKEQNKFEPRRNWILQPAYHRIYHAQTLRSYQLGVGVGTRADMDSFYYRTHNHTHFLYRLIKPPF